MKNDTSDAKMHFLLASTGSVFTEADYQALSEQIEVHKYLVNQNIPRTISWDDAVFSWMENVFSPIMQVISRWEVLAAFPKHTMAQLFFEISNHWYFLLEKNPHVYVQYAAIDYAATYGKGLGRWISKLQLPKKVA
jgi:hypothetical protein